MYNLSDSPAQSHILFLSNIQTRAKLLFHFTLDLALMHSVTVTHTQTLTDAHTEK